MTYDFGYTWVWTHGHLVPFAVFAVFIAVSVWRRWPRWLTALGGVLALWALAGFAITQVVLRANQPMGLPTASFLRSGAGRVLDLGAGSGRSSLMVLQSRPGAHVTAVDIYSGYFGIDDNTPARLMANARVAGVADRIDVTTADIRSMPFPDASYDAAVSAFVIDHLNREGVTRSLAEVARVLKPGGLAALVGYGLLRIDPALDAVVDAFYTDGVGRFWPPERRLVDGGYREIDFPFREVPAPQIDMTADWNQGQFLGYIATWSAVKAAEKQGLDPLPAFTDAITALWPDKNQFRTIRWPLLLRVGYSIKGRESY